MNMGRGAPIRLVAYASPAGRGASVKIDGKCGNIFEALAQTIRKNVPSEK